MTHDLPLGALLLSPESELLDFKLKHHENPADLVHDVLCLANARGDGDRYLVFGVVDNPRAVKGVPPEDRRTLADIAQLLRQLAVSRMPALTMEEMTWDGKLVDVLCIGDRPQKPYVLGRDHRHGKTTVRCGVVYIRHADSNTPLDSSAPDAEIEFMFRQRLGLDLSPVERFPIYLADKDKWQGNQDELGQFYYYKPFPEFTIREIEDNHAMDYEEPWHLSFPDNKAHKDEYSLKYHATRLKSVWVVWCDGARFAVPLPHRHVPKSAGGDGNVCCFYQVADDLKTLVASVIDTSDGGQAATRWKSTIRTFASEEEAKRVIDADWDSGKRRLTYYQWDDDKRCYQMLKGQKPPVDLRTSRTPT